MIFGLSVEKNMAFRGGVQPFSNVYHYEGPLTVGSNAELNTLLDIVVAKEKGQHGAHVNFQRGRVWRADGTKAENQMIVDKPLSGAGAIPTHNNMDRERAYLVRFRAGNDSRGRPVYLRKYFHFGGSLFFGTAPSNDQLSQLAALTSAMRNDFATWADGFKDISDVPGAVPSMKLVSKNGRNIDGNTQAHPFIEHHQLGDEWRG